MGRPHRQDPEGGWHHVYNRGIRKTPIFLDDQHNLNFLALIAESSKRHGVEIHGFCLVGNHFHLLVHCPEAGLSDMLHLAAGEYSKWFNYRNDTDGPLCRGRFGSRLLKNEREVLIVSAYVHRNSLDIQPLTPMDQYRWSSSAQYRAGNASPADLHIHTDPVLSLAGGHAAYWGFVATAAGPIEELFANYARQAAWKRLDEIDAVVALHHTCSTAEVRVGTNRVPARQTAVLLAAVDPAVPRDVAADHYEYSGPSSLNTAIYKLRRQHDRPELWAAVATLGPRLGLDLHDAT